MNTLSVETIKSSGAWEIAGIQHEIFLRVLAGIRHEMVGPISVSRMAISVLKRTLEKGDPGKEAIQQQVMRMDEQMQQSVLGIRALSLWDADSTTLAPVNYIVRQGLKLMAYRLSMRGILVDDEEIAAGSNPETGATGPAHSASDPLPPGQVPHQAFLYTWLGLLGHVEDCHYPATLKVASASPAGVSVQLIPVEKPSNSQNEIKPNFHGIDQPSLLALAAHCGFAIKFTPGQISLGWENAAHPISTH